MASRSEKAADSFSKGFNCAQSVFSAFAPSYGMEESEALKIASGFGAGMARLQEVCGAVTGAFMVIGAANGDEVPADLIQPGKRLTKKFGLSTGASGDYTAPSSAETFSAWT